MTDDDFRDLVLAFPETTEGAHGGLPTFRVRGRRFATLGWPEPGHVSVVLNLDQQALLLATCADVFKRAPGAWGRRGHGQLNLCTADDATVLSVAAMAWRLSAPNGLVLPFG